ncbi:MAG: hypothetical protein NC418_04890 [Muribaculaceae bacterium]|nr:hypothetical protein [Muribaculaceae bacterium]
MAAILLVCGVFGLRMCITGGGPVVHVAPVEQSGTVQPEGNAADSIRKSSRKKPRKQSTRPAGKPVPQRSYLDEPVALPVGEE